MEKSPLEGTSGELQDWISVIERLPEVAPQIDVACLLTPQQEFISINKSASFPYSVGSDDLIGKKCYRMIHDQDEPIKECPCLETLETGEAAVGGIFQEGDHYFLPASAPITGGCGEIEAIAHTISEVTEQVESRESLRRYKRAIQRSTDLICATDLDNQYIFANTSYCEFHGVEPSNIINMTVEDVLNADTYAEIEPHVDRALDGEEVSFKMERSRPNGQTRIFDVRYYPLHERTQNIGVVAVMRDITEREHARRQLQVVDDLLRHTIRNEMTVIRGRAEQIIDQDEGNGVNAAESILSTADSLIAKSAKSRIITSILTDEPIKTQFNIKSIVIQAVEDVLDNRPNAKVIVSVTDGIRGQAIPKFSIAIEELVENAIIHNPNDSPTVVISSSYDEETVSIIVSDDGPGIPEMERDVLVSGKSPEPLDHGSGFGIWLVYWIINWSGGDITVRERHPKGSIVELELSRVK